MSRGLGDVYKRQLAEQVFIDGALAFDRNTGFGPVSDFDVGIVDPREDRVND